MDSGLMSSPPEVWVYNICLSAACHTSPRYLYIASGGGGGLTSAAIAGWGGGSLSIIARI